MLAVQVAEWDLKVGLPREIHHSQLGASESNPGLWTVQFDEERHFGLERHFEKVDGMLDSHEGIAEPHHGEWVVGFEDRGPQWHRYGD
jgi:hypothetical protein